MAKTDLSPRPDPLFSVAVEGPFLVLTVTLYGLFARTGRPFASYPNKNYAHKVLPGYWSIWLEDAYLVGKLRPHTSRLLDKLAARLELAAVPDCVTRPTSLCTCVNTRWRGKGYNCKIVMKLKHRRLPVAERQMSTEDLLRWGEAWAASENPASPVLAPSGPPGAWVYDEGEGHWQPNGLAFNPPADTFEAEYNRRLEDGGPAAVDPEVHVGFDVADGWPISMRTFTTAPAPANMRAILNYHFDPHHLALAKAAGNTQQELNDLARRLLQHAIDAGIPLSQREGTLARRLKVRPK